MTRTKSFVFGIACLVGLGLAVWVRASEASLADEGSAASTARAAIACPTWEIDFQLVGASASVGALQLEINYVGAPGDFRGSGSSVICTRIAGTNAAYNDNDGTRKLGLGWSALNGFTAPRLLTTCVFDASDTPSQGDFNVTVKDAVTPNFDPVAVNLAVVLRAASGQSDCPGFCGDGQLDPQTEQCDDGNTSNTDACTTLCKLARCGDGYVRDGVEQCDDTNTVNTDTCTNGCKTAVCGDGIVETGVEQCDDGNTSNTDSCASTCKTATCGDGFTQPGNGEQCDDANTKNNDACTNTCKTAVCGDGILHVGVEQCDDGNSSNTDGCVSGCVLATCGDGYVRSGFEQCDDGNVSNTDACLNTCRNARCGDGFIRAGVEQCDDGNASSSDACLADCTTAYCGDGFVYVGVEECDDGGSVDGDGCSASCQNQRQCGDATDDNEILVSDALRTLQRAVGQDVDCPDWICDVNDDGEVAAVDALALLKASVGLPVLLNCGEPAALVLRLATPDVLGALEVEVNYAGVAGDLHGDGPDVHCEGLVPGANYAFNDKPTKVLSMSVLALDGFSGPRSVARCEFTPTANVEPEDFAVTVLDATSPSGQPVAGVQVRALPW